MGNENQKEQEPAEKDTKQKAREQQLKAAKEKKKTLQKMLVKESSKQSKDFEADMRKTTNDKQQQKIAKQPTAIPPPQNKMCCHQCQLPQPLICWRNKIRRTLAAQRVRQKQDCKDKRQLADCVFIE